MSTTTLGDAATGRRPQRRPSWIRCAVRNPVAVARYASTALRGRVCPARPVAASLVDAASASPGPRGVVGPRARH